MKTFFKLCIRFLMVIIPSYIFFTVLFGSILPSFLTKNLYYKRGGIGFMDKRLSELKSVKNIDLLFIGSSHTYRGYDPSFFESKGFKCFNLGSSAQTPSTTLYLLEEYLDKLNPSVVILDIYPLLMTTDGKESLFNLISNSELTEKLIKFSLEFKDIDVLNTLLFKVFKSSFSSDSNIISSDTLKNDVYMQKGFVYCNTKYKNNVNDILVQQKLIFNKKQLEKLMKIISLLKSRGVKYAIVQAPITKLKYSSFTNNKEIDSLLMSFGDYYNFNIILELPDTMFIDDNHLNSDGVKTYNTIFYKTLSRVFNK